MAEAAVSERSSPLRYEELGDFLYELRRTGFRFSTGQYTSAHNVFLALAAEGSVRSDPAHLRTYLAPLFCSSPEQQQLFYQRFDYWLAQRLPALPPPEPSPESSDSGNVGASGAGEHARPLWARRAPRLAAALILTAALAAAAYLILRPAPPPLPPPPSRVLAGEVRDATTNAPIFGAEINFDGRAGNSDAAGRFSITYESPSPEPVVTITHPKYITKGEPVALGPEGAQNLSLKLVPASAAPPTRETPTPEPSPAASPSASPSETAATAATPTAAPSETPDAPSSPVLSLSELYARYYLWLLALFASLPFVAYLLWRVWRLIRRRQLERWRTREQPDLTRLVVKGVEAYLYRGTTFRRFAQELRRHRRLKSNVLDSASTAEATSRTGGLFSPVYGTRQLTPDYLVLVDRKNFRDQQAQLDEEIVNRLKREGVFVDSFYFEGDPRICRKRGTRVDEPYRTLQDLTSRYPDHRLILFGDGAGLFDPLSGRPHGWVEQFESWEVRTLLTPAPEWGYREWALEQAGFAVLPAWTEGMAALVEAIRTGRKPKAKGHAGMGDYPQLLLRRPERWLKERAPAPERVEELRLQLRYYLGTEGYHLLAACAVYPQLLWGLTFYLAYHLVGEKRREETLEALLRLPWLRHGTMPEWLRSDLITHLPPERDARTRDALEKLLANYVRHPQEGFRLEVAPEPAEAGGAAGRFFRRVGRKLGELRWLKFLHDMLRTEPKESPLRDYVFVNFMSGSKLAVSLPAKVRLFLYRRGQPLLGLHPVRGLVLPALLALAGTTTLLSFEPDIKPSTFECGLPCQIPGLSDLMARLPTPTPSTEPIVTPVATPDPATGAVVGTCRNDLVEADGYLIRRVGYKDEYAASMTDATRLYNLLYSPGILRFAEPIVRNMFDASQASAVGGRKELLDLTPCVKVIAPDACRSSIKADRCVDLEYTARTRVPGALEIVSPPNPARSPDVPLTVRNISPSTETLWVEVRNADSNLKSLNMVSVPRGVSELTIPVKLAPSANTVIIYDPRRPDAPHFQARATITYDDGDLRRFIEGVLDVRLEGPGKASVEMLNRSVGGRAAGTVSRYDYVGIPLRITVPKGEYLMRASAEGYELTDRGVFVRSRAERPAGDSVVMVLRPMLLPTPTPTLTPTPAPPPTINSVEVSLETTDDDKDVNSSIRVRLLYNGEIWGQLGPFGRGRGWDKNTTQVINVPLKSPIPLDACRRVSIQVRQGSDNDERWHALLRVQGTLSDGRKVLLLAWTEEFRLRSGSGSGDNPEFVRNLTCP